MSLECPYCERFVYRPWIGLSPAGMTKCECGREILWERETGRWHKFTNEYAKTKERKVNVL